MRSYGAAPPFGTWLSIRVASCQSVTFAPPDDPAIAQKHLYVAGERVTVTLVVGEVVNAKNFTRNGEWDFGFPPPADELIGKPYVGFLNERPSSCSESLPAEIVFVRAWGCDAGWRRGQCLPPFPQLERARTDEVFKFVDGAKR